MDELHIEGMYDAKAWSEKTGLKCSGESLTQQSMRDEADINVLVKRFGVTGQMPVSVRVPEYQDFDAVFDYQSAQNAIIEADRSFMAMPADVRNRFGNSPQAFLEFCANPDNLDEMRKLGLAVPAPEVVPPEPVVTPVTPA
ncbi:MAG: internal scaffolding protein [Microvirus sp.]|nr:MAG: internal scaffolding protein [Microvirus sp.]